MGTYKINITDPNSTTRMTGKIDLSDITFLVPLRIDSPERKENIDTIIKNTYQYFNTSFIVIEADAICRFNPKTYPVGFHYEFIEDKNEVFHRTKWINRLISMADTTFVAVWDADAIAPYEQIINAVEMLRAGQAIMSFPFDGRFYSCDKVSCDLFKKILEIEILMKRIPVMRLMHGFHSVGGAFIVNKEKYMDTGGENENIYGGGTEDTERVKRLEILGLPIFYSPGVLFHLWHPRGKNSWFANAEFKEKNRKELLRTCKIFNINQTK